MKLNVMFIIAAIYGIAIGLMGLLAPQKMVTIGGLTASTGLLMSIRFLGVSELGLGLIALFVRNTDASTARDAVTLGLTLYFALHALTSLYGQFTDASTNLHWLMATIQGLIAVGFFLAGRTSMSKSAS